MNMSVLKLITVVFCTLSVVGLAQNVNPSDSLLEEKRLFEQNDLLPVKLKYSRKVLKKETNDSTFMDSELVYQMKNGDWKTLSLKIRARGNFRRKNCYFTPLKLKIKKKEAKETIFKGQKKLKMVLPCLNESSKDDNVIKEYVIYKMFEVISPYSFSTRLIDVEYEDTKVKKSKLYQLKGILIEDDETVAKRLDGKITKRTFSPEGYDDLAAIRLAMFQYMIGNTDYSVTKHHNVKVVFVDKKFIPVPYDFDLAGYVNTSYAIVSQTRKQNLPIEKVTERYYMGYQRDYKLFQQVRQEFIAHKQDLLAIINAHKSYFENNRNYTTAKNYIDDFFRILANEAVFKKSTYDRSLKIKSTP
jgi:hypothetical protein